MSESGAHLRWRARPRPGAGRRRLRLQTRAGGLRPTTLEDAKATEQLEQILAANPNDPEALAAQDELHARLDELNHLVERIEPRAGHVVSFFATGDGVVAIAEPQPKGDPSVVDGADRSSPAAGRSSLRAPSRSSSHGSNHCSVIAREDRWKLAREVGDVGAAVVPERPAVGDVGEAEDLLHAAVAVGRDDEDVAGERGYPGDRAAPRAKTAGSVGGDERLLEAAGDASAKDLLARYCKAPYARHGTYEEVARRTGLDRRTVKSYVAAG